MEWSATDQFGNLYEGISDAQSLDELRPHVLSLIEQLHERVGEAFSVTVDIGYCEIVGPDPENVSHIMRVAWLEGQDKDEVRAGVSAMVEEICAEKGIDGVAVGMG